MLEKSAYLAHFASDGEALSRAARRSPDATCIACPDWTLQGLVEHCLGVFSFVDGIVEARSESPVPADVPEWGTVDELFEAFDAKHRGLVDNLAAVDGDVPMWNWTSNKTASFFFRRMAHETAVHRWDAESSAGGDVASIDADLAHDGIDEVIEVGMQSNPRGREYDYPAESLHLHRTDGPGEWMLRSTEAGVLEVTHEHGKGDAAVRGSAEGLYLYLWGRGRAGLEVFGDESVADAWAAIAP